LNHDSESIGRVILDTGSDNYQKDNLSKIRIVSANYGEFYLLHAIIYQLDLKQKTEALSKRKQRGRNSGVRVCVHMAELKMRFRLTTCVR
jgi:hypothetical protein